MKLLQYIGTAWCLYYAAGLRPKVCGFSNWPTGLAFNINTILLHCSSVAAAAVAVKRIDLMLCVQGRIVRDSMQ